MSRDALLIGGCHKLRNKIFISLDIVFNIVNTRCSCSTKYAIAKIIIQTWLFLSTRNTSHRHNVHTLTHNDHWAEIMQSQIMATYKTNVNATTLATLQSTTRQSQALHASHRHYTEVTSTKRQSKVLQTRVTCGNCCFSINADWLLAGRGSWSVMTSQLYRVLTSQLY